MSATIPSTETLQCMLDELMTLHHAELSENGLGGWTFRFEPSENLDCYEHGGYILMRDCTQGAAIAEFHRLLAPTIAENKRKGRLRGGRWWMYALGIPQ